MAFIKHNAETFLKGTSITQALMANDAIGTNQILNDNITPAKLDDTLTYLMAGLDYASGGGPLAIGASNATSVDIGAVGVITTIKGELVVDGGRTDITSGEVHIGDSEVIYNEGITALSANSGGGMHIKRVTEASAIATTSTVASTNTINVASDSGYSNGTIFYLQGTTQDGLYKVASTTVSTIVIDTGAPELGVRTSLEDETVAGSTNKADPALVRWNETTDLWEFGSLLGGLVPVVGTTSTQTLTNKTLTTPTIASFANMAHNHSNAAGGGNIPEGSITDGSILARLAANESITGNWTVATAKTFTITDAQGLVLNGLALNDTTTGGATKIGNKAVGNLASTNVQASLEELQTEIDGITAGGNNSLEQFEGDGTVATYAAGGTITAGGIDVRVVVDGIAIMFQDNTVITSGGFTISTNNIVLPNNLATGSFLEIQRVNAPA